MFLLHGDNTVTSRNQLVMLISQAKDKGVKDIINLDGKKITETDLIQALETQSLFGTDRLVVIENLLARPKSKTKKNLTSYLKENLNAPNSTQTILWEQKSATTSQIKSLGNPKQQEFKVPKNLFKLLESLNPSNQKQSLKLLQATKKEAAPELILFMLVRQIRLLIQAGEPQTLKLAPWQAGKLKSQAQQFSTSQLLALHKKLLILDHQIKTGQNLLSVQDNLDTIVATI